MEYLSRLARQTGRIFQWVADPIGYGVPLVGVNVVLVGQDLSWKDIDLLKKMIGDHKLDGRYEAKTSSGDPLGGFMHGCSIRKHRLLSMPSPMQG